MINLDELMRLHEASTPGPWKVATWYGGYHTIRPKKEPEKSLGQIERKHDAAYIVAACDSVPKMVERIMELEAQRDWLAGQAAKLKNKLWPHEKGFFDMPRTATKAQWRYFAEEYVKGNLEWGDDDDEDATQKSHEIDTEWLLLRFTEVK